MYSSIYSSLIISFEIRAILHVRFESKKRIELYPLYAIGVPGGTRTHIGGLGGSCVIPLRYGNIIIEFLRFYTYFYTYFENIFKNGAFLLIFL